VIFVDLDRFKEINDTRGHLVGDKVLERVAEVLLESTRPTDSVFRYGGDEFIVVLPDTGIDDATLVSENLNKYLRDCSMMDLALSRGFQTASIGVSSSEESLTTAKALIESADERAYLSKQSGGDCVTSNKGVERL
jgi:diguanylate cyclase (GGDEF)-like protein